MCLGLNPLEQGIIEGENPVFDRVSHSLRYVFDESGCLGMQPKMGGKFHLKLNIGTRPIANKYREGKMKRTLKRELKVRETVKREAIGASICAVGNQPDVLGTQASVSASRLVCAPWMRPVHFSMVQVSISFGCGKRVAGRCPSGLRSAGSYSLSSIPRKGLRMSQRVPLARALSAGVSCMGDCMQCLVQAMPLGG